MARESNHAKALSNLKYCNQKKKIEREVGAKL